MFHRLLGIIIICCSFAAGWLMLELQQFSRTPLKVPKGGVDYTLSPGSSFGSLATDLQSKGYISSALYLSIIARWTEQANKIRAGEYHIAPGTTPEQLLSLFVSGQVNTYNITLVEGWTFRQMLVAIRNNQALKQTLEGMSDQQIMQRLGHANEHPEGRFLPDTYNFPKGFTDLVLLERAYQAMEKVLAKEWEKRQPKLPYDNPYQALILASIVEKETAAASERSLIAGVFVRRLRKNMKLQTDPTVIYGMGDKYKGNIRRKDLTTDTPYNTYVHRGLTPTPISMPGREAIKAVMQPSAGKSLYFVARGEGDGTHQFSATLKEHNKAVRKYQLKR